MPEAHIVLLDGSEPGDDRLAPIRAALLETLRQSGAVVTVFALREMKIGHCVGCFGCWVKTPGVCLQPDGGREIVTALIASDQVVLFGPVVFGSYGPVLKRAVDRCVSPLLQPFMKVYHGETHHIPRYAHSLRLVGIGVQSRPDELEANLFKALVGRNALNLHAPSYAAGVVQLNADSGVLRQQLAALLARSDAFPYRAELQSIQPHPDPARAAAEDHPCRKALFLVGSPKGKHSTSASLSTELSARLESRGWETGTLTLRANLEVEKNRADLRTAVRGATLLVLAFPLYNDSLPVLVLQALCEIAAERAGQAVPTRQRLVVLVNNGFPEAYQNTPALAICRAFAAQSGIEWAGSLALGGGEALSSGQPFSGRSGLPSVQHVVAALDQTAEALHADQPIPDQAAELITKTPLPWTPFRVWRWIFLLKASERWKKQAAEMKAG